MSSSKMFEPAGSENEGKFAKKVKDSPFMIVGLAGFIGAGLWGAYKYKTRGSMSTSVYLMQLRVTAQSAVIGCLTLGLAYTMAREYFVSKQSKEE